MYQHCAKDKTLGVKIEEVKDQETFISHLEDYCDIYLTYQHNLCTPYGISSSTGIDI